MNQGTSTILMLVVLFAIMYFLMIRPENKRKKKAQEMTSPHTSQFPSLP